MKKDFSVRLKNIFTYLTLGWSAVMAVVYITALFEIPLFMLISFLPFGDFICRIAEAMMLFGIWAVPLLWIVSVGLGLWTRRKAKEENRNKCVVVAAAVLPLILAVFMLLTDFIDVLS